MATIITSLAKKHEMLLAREPALVLLWRKLERAQRAAAGLSVSAGRAERTEALKSAEGAVATCLAYLRLKQRKWLSHGGVAAIKSISHDEQMGQKEEGSLYSDLLGLRERMQRRLLAIAAASSRGDGAGARGKPADGRAQRRPDKKAGLGTGAAATGVINNGVVGGGGVVKKRDLKPRHRWLTRVLMEQASEELRERESARRQEEGTQEAAEESV